MAASSTAASAETLNPTASALESHRKVLKAIESVCQDFRARGQDGYVGLLGFRAVSFLFIPSGLRSLMGDQS